MHVEFLESNALLLQHVVVTMINAVINRKKWLDKALMTQKPHRNHAEPIKQSTNQPVLTLLHNVAHVGIENSLNIPKPSKADLPLASFK